MHHLSNWIEIPVKDMKRAQTFYQGVLKVELAAMDLGPNRYALFPTEDRFNSGALAQGEGYEPSNQGVTVYFDGSEGIELILARVSALGGTILLTKTFLAAEAGFIGLFLDSEGNKIGLQQM